MEAGDSDPSKLEFERIQIFYNSVTAGYLGVSAAIAMLAFIAAEYASAKVAGLWLLGCVICNLPRLWLSLRFFQGLRAGHITPANIAPWNRRMIIANTIAYTAFVAAIFLPFTEHALTAVVLCAFAFMVLSTGGTMVLMTSFTNVAIYLGLVFAAIIARFIPFHEPVLYVISMILVFGYIQLLKLTRHQSQLLIENIALKLHNERSALIDPLTRLGNRRRLGLHIEVLLPAVARSGDAFSVILLDIDHFKEFNDSHGHSAGDEVLVEVAEVLRACSRNQDLAVRYGGEEFLLVLPRTGLEGAQLFAERIRDAVQAGTVVTISAGVAEHQPDEPFEELLARADTALYRAKDRGRNQCAADSANVQCAPLEQAGAQLATS